MLKDNDLKLIFEYFEEIDINTLQPELQKVAKKLRLTVIQIDLSNQYAEDMKQLQKELKKVESNE